jgi:uncharacterized membrane protein
MENENQEQNISEYDFNIIEIIKAGWAHMEGVKAQFFIGLAIYVVIAIIIQLLLGLVFPSGTTEEPNLLNQQIVGILSYPVLMPLMVGIMMMAIQHTRGESIDFKSIFNYYHLTGKLALAGILIYIMTVVGLLLLILPGIYLSIAYVFALPLIVDKNMGVWDAMEHSRKSVTKHWFKVFGLMLLLSIVLFLSAIPLGIGLIWTVPLMFITMYGLLYPVIFDN